MKEQEVSVLENINRTIKRGDIYRADLSDMVIPNSCIQQGSRPVVVIQNNVGNANAPTVIVALITAKQKKDYPMHQHIEIFKPSTVLYEQILTIDKYRLIEFIREMSNEELAEMDYRLGISLGMREDTDIDLKALKVISKTLTVTRDNKKDISYCINLFTEKSVYEVTITSEELLEYLGDDSLEDCENDLEYIENRLDCIRGINFILPKVR